MHNQMLYRRPDIAPEATKVIAIWESPQEPIIGISWRFKNQWFVSQELLNNPEVVSGCYGKFQPYALSGYTCNSPQGWLPLDGREWTGAEKALEEMLVANPKFEDRTLQKDVEQLRLRLSMIKDIQAKIK